MKILKSGLTKRVIVFGFSLMVVTAAFLIINHKFYLVSKPDEPQGQVAGTVTSPLLINNKFCDNPASADQHSCTSFIPSVLAAVLTSPYQDVSGPVNISGSVSMSTTGYQLDGTAMSTALKTFAGSLGTTATNELSLASIGFTSGNNTSLGIRAYRRVAGTDWQSTAIGLGMDVDNTPRAGGASLWLSSNGGIGIGTAGPAEKLNVNGNIRLGIPTAQYGHNTYYVNTADLSGTNDLWTSDIYLKTGDVSSTFGVTGSITLRTGNKDGQGDNVWDANDTGNIILQTGTESNPYRRGVVQLQPEGGNVGIGTAGPVAKLDVAGEIHSSSTAAGFYLGAGCTKDNWLRLTKIAGACAVADYHDLAVGQFWSNGSVRFDLAEITPSNATDNLEQGDIVVIDPTKGTRITKSAKPYDTTVYGIVSSYEQAAMVIGGDTPPEEAKNVKDKTPVALVGRVKAKVSTENGPIEVGDYLTSSSTPGLAMKATRPGPIVGKALEAFPTNTSEVKKCDYTSEADCGKIMAFVNVSWYDPDVNLTSTDNFHLDFNQLKNAGNNLITRIGAFGKLIVGNIQAGIIETQKLIINGVDVLDKLNMLSQKVDTQQKEIESLKQEIEQLEAKVQ